MSRRVVDRPDPPRSGPDPKRLAALGRVAKRFGEWKPAREVLTRVRAVRTIFPQVNHGTRVGGWPLQRPALIHGPSNHGKTAFAHGLGLSFLRAGHYYCYVDAEFATPSDWVDELMGELADFPSFLAQRPTTYEDTVEAVRHFVTGIAQARTAGEVPPDTSGLLVVDSLRKLVPKRQQEKLAKEEGGIDGMGGRMAMYKAALNSAWMDELVPLLYHGDMALMFIGRESENTGMLGEDWKLTGGKGLVFDSSIVARVTRASWVERGDQTVGERHCVSIWKTRVGGKSGRVVDCYFHTSNGELIPAGFDPARDALELARARGLVTLSGSWLTWGDVAKWNGVHAAVKALSEDQGLLDRLLGELER